MTLSRRTWIFDLDNTLHDARPHIFPHINRSMTDYVQTHLQVERAEANRIRLDYWRRYGATLVGLMHHHDVDPDHFLLETHDFPALEKMVVARSVTEASASGPSASPLGDLWASRGASRGGAEEANREGHS